jgi:hypothetical protein
MRKIKHPKEKLFFFCGLLLYVLFLRLIGSTCLIRTVFRIPCPGCGMTRALCSLLTLNFPQAFAYHPLVFLLPLVLLYILFDELFGKKVDTLLIAGMAAAFLAVWILRLTGVLVCL